MRIRVDWTRRAGYVRARHAVETEWADEAVADAHAVWLEPDPASRSGLSVRVIGYSATARELLTVILVSAEADQKDRPKGDWWGSNAWVANERDRRLYGREEL
ncbi:MAG: transposase [Acidimicrobiales bacterium]